VQFRNSHARYGLVARVLHWTSVALLGATVITAPRAAASANAAAAGLAAERHAVLGLVLMVVVVARIAWRARNPNPLEAYPMARWAKLLARVTHGFLYAAIVVQCALGIVQAGTAWLAVQSLVLAEGSTLAVLPGLPVGALVEMHVRLSAVVLGAIALHVSGALAHQLFVR